MSIHRRRNRRRATVIGMSIGFIMVLTMVIGLIAPSRGQNNTTVYTAAPIQSPAPTSIIIPTPEVDPSLDGQPAYIHPSGYFQTYVPAGRDWQVVQDPEAANADPTYAGIVIQSVNRLAVIHTYLQQGVEYASVDSLSENYFNPAEFDTNWGQYDAWVETGRTIADERITIDFDLRLSGFAYFGRTISWLDNNFLYVARLVTPDNNGALLDLLTERVTANFKGYHDTQALPQTWPLYQDRTLGFMVKHAPGWGMIAGGEGRPTTFRIPFGQVRVMTDSDQTIDSKEDAEQWLMDNEQGVTILTSQIIERSMGSGYAIAYAYQDAAGDPHSGLVTLLTGADNTVYIANAQIETPDIDLLVTNESTSAVYYDLQRSLTQGLIVLTDDAR